MKAKAILYYIIVIYIIANIIRGAILSSLELNMVGISILLFQVFLLMLVLAKNEFTSVGIIGWCIISITKNMIPFVGLLLEHGHNNFIDVEIGDIISKLVKILIAILFWIIATKISFIKVKSSDGE